MERMNLLFSQSGSVSQKDMEAKVNAVKSQITATILSKISQERYEWQPSISSESAESYKISNLNAVQVNLLSKFNDMGRVTDTLRNIILNSFLSNGTSDTLICESMSIVTMNFVDLFKSMCSFMDIESGKTLNIQIVSEENSDGTVKKSPNFIETLLNSKVEVDHVKNFRWNKRLLKGESSTSQKRRLKDNSASTDPKRPKLNGSDDSVEHQNNITIDSQVELLDVDDDKHIFPVRSEHVEKLGNYQFFIIK